jgi:hypothetical protein
VDYYHRHPDKLEFQLLAQMVFLWRTYVQNTRAFVLYFKYIYISISIYIYF